MTVQLPLTRLRNVMRARGAATPSELLNALLAEEAERIESEAVLRTTAGSARARDIDDRLH